MSTSLDRDKKIEHLVRLYKVRDQKLYSGLDPETAYEIYRRSLPVGSTIFHVKRAQRLMPIAKEAILAYERKGRDILSGTIWRADELNGAKGRFTRAWWAPNGGIYLCIALFPHLLPENWSLYNLAVGVAISQVLREWQIDASVRWVNDVLIKGKKVAGVLTETLHAPISNQTYLIFGIGINVNIKYFPEYLPETTSLLRETGRMWPIHDLAAHIIARIGWLFGDLHRWDATCPNQLENPVIRAWLQVKDTIGKKVNYGPDLPSCIELCGTALGIRDDGSLEIELGAGNIVVVNSGEVRYEEA